MVISNMADQMLTHFLANSQGSFYIFQTPSVSIVNRYLVGVIIPQYQTECVKWWGTFRPMSCLQNKWLVLYLLPCFNFNKPHTIFLVSGTTRTRDKLLLLYLLLIRLSLLNISGHRTHIHRPNTLKYIYYLFMYYYFVLLILGHFLTCSWSLYIPETEKTELIKIKEKLNLLCVNESTIYTVTVQ